jgi:hypothetical protein
MKTCNVCFISKNIDNFYLFPRNKGGLSHECKQCGRARKKINYIKNKDKILFRQKLRIINKGIKSVPYEKWSSLSKEKHKIRYKKHKEKYPTKYAARDGLKKYIDKHPEFKKPCTICGEIKSEGHHPDYTKPLAVIWLCKKHHHEEHKRLKKMKIEILY